MRTTIDKAGRVVVPKVLRDRVGLVAGEVDIIVDGTGLRIELPGEDRLVRGEDGLLLLAPGGPVLTVDDVRELRLADQR